MMILLPSIHVDMRRLAWPMSHDRLSHRRQASIDFAVDFAERWDKWLI
jgi:hypothetical protein